MKCNSGIPSVIYLDAQKSQKAYKIWCDLLGASNVPGVTPENSIGAAFACEAQDEKNLYIDAEGKALPNSSIGVFAGELQKSGKRNVYYLINARSKSNAKLAADGMFGVTNGYTYEALSQGLQDGKSKLHYWFEQSFPDKVISLTFEQTSEKSAHEYAVRGAKAVKNGQRVSTSSDGNSEGIFIEPNPAGTSENAVIKALKSKEFFLDSYFWTNHCKHIREKDYLGRLSDKTTAGFLLEDVPFLFKFLEKIDMDGLPLYIVFRVRKLEVLKVSDYLNAITTISSIASVLLPGVGAIIPGLGKLENLVKEVKNICQSDAVLTLANVIDTGKYTGNLLDLAASAASFLSPEIVRGIEHTAGGIVAKTTNFVADKFNKPDVSKLIGLAEIEKSAFMTALQSGGAGLITSFQGITQEAANKFTDTMNYLQNYKNIAVCDLLNRFSFSNSDPFDLKQISFVTDRFSEPEKFFYGAIAGASGFPVAAENWLEYSVQSIVEASASEPSKVITLPPEIDGDLRECLVQKLKEANRQVLMCDKGYKYNTSTKQCERAGFFSQYVTPKNVVLAGTALFVLCHSKKTF